MLNEFLEDYQEYEEDEALDDFIFNLWESKYEPRTYTKSYRFFIDANVMTDVEMIKLFEPYTNIKVKYAKSYYNDSPTSIDMIKIRVNNMYLFLTHKEVYLGKSYYDTLFEYRSLYFKTIDRIKNDEIVSLDEIENKLNDVTKRLNELKNERLKTKIDLKFSDYKELINGYIYRIFNNYKPPHVYEDEFGWEMRDEYLGWTEDNYIVRYFCKSLTGYLQHYVRDINYLRCKLCNSKIRKTNKSFICRKCRDVKKYSKNCCVCGDNFKTNYEQQISCNTCRNEKEKMRKLLIWNKHKNKYRKC